MRYKLTCKKSRAFFGCAIILLFLFFYFFPGAMENSPAKWLLFPFAALLCGASAWLLFYEVRLSPEKHTLITRRFLLLTPAYTLFATELIQRNVMMPWRLSFYLSLALYYAVYLLCFLLTNRIRFSVIMPAIPFFILSVVNYYTILFRQTALQPWDFAAARTAANVVSGVKLTVSSELMFGALLLIFLWTASLQLNFKIYTPDFLHRRNKRIWAAALALSLFCTGNLLWNTGWLQLSQWDTIKTSQENGLAINLLLNWRIMENTPPKDYSNNAVQEIVSTLPEESISVDTPIVKTDEQPAEVISKPSIIVVMNETFSDLSVFGDLNTNKDVMPFVHSLTENTIRGQLVVPVFGGGTCNTEYEFLTGNVCAMLRPGSYPMQQFVLQPSPSLATVLKANGYGTVAIHPYEPSGWARSRAYPYLGFDNFFSIGDFKNPQILRKYISDRSSYEKVIEQYENRGDHPVFIFNVTMQNHCGYDTLYDNFPEDISFPEEEQFPKTKQYLSLIKQSDLAVEELVKYFNQQDDPVIVVFFGDHQPAIEGEYYDYLCEQNGISAEKKAFLQHQVPFFLWANFPIDEQKDVRLSVNYLSTLLLKSSEVQAPEYVDYLNELKEILPVITTTGYETRYGHFYSWEDESSPYAQILEDYDKIQYNQVFDTQNRADKVFYVPHVKTYRQDDIAAYCVM